MPDKKQLTVEAIKSRKYKKYREIMDEARNTSAVVRDLKGKKPAGLSAPERSAMRKAATAYGEKGYPASVTAVRTHGTKDEPEGFIHINTKKKKKAKK